jgi:TPR repeat protein
LGHPVDYLRRLLQLSNRTHATTSIYSARESSCAASAALYWHEARLAVGGDKESGVHPTPIQELKLSTADSEEIDRHRGGGGDEGTYQLSAADAGDVHAQKWIATRFYHGLNGFPQDLPRAAEYFAAAGDAGDAEARYNYGVMRLTGQDGAAANPTEAQGHFEAAAEQNFAPALNGMGIGHMGRGNGMVTSGDGQIQNFTKAAEYFRRAARQNSADGHYNLGALYKDGQGVPKNIPVAIMHMVIAAMLGQHRAQWTLGSALHKSDSFLARYLASNEFSENKTKVEVDDVGKWENDQGGYLTFANASIQEGVYVDISGSVVDLPLQMNCDWAVEYLRPLAETRAAGSAFREGVQSYLDNDLNEAERKFQESSWMGLSVGSSNSAFLLRQDKRKPGSTEALWPLTREEHSFSYSVVAAQRGDAVEHVALASALSEEVGLVVGERRREAASRGEELGLFPPLMRAGDGASSIDGASDLEGGEFSNLDESSYPNVDLRLLTIAAWEGASIVGSPEATVEMGMKHIFGDEELSIPKNETLAREYLVTCSSKYGVGMLESFSVECLPAQLILWYLDGKTLIEYLQRRWIVSESP